MAARDEHAPHPLVAELRRLRIDGGRKLATIARRLGTSTSTVSSWEMGVRSPRIEAVAAFASELGYELVLRRRVFEAEITPSEAARNRALLAWADGHQDDYVPGDGKAGAA